MNLVHIHKHTIDQLALEFRTRNNRLTTFNSLCDMDNLL